MHKICNI